MASSAQVYFISFFFSLPSHLRPAFCLLQYIEINGAKPSEKDYDTKDIMYDINASVAFRTPNSKDSSDAAATPLSPGCSQQ